MSKQQKGTSNKDKGVNPNILRRALDGVDIRPGGLLNLGLKSWQTALDRSRSIARLAERHNHYSDFSRHLSQSHVVPLSMPRLDMRVVSRYLRLDTAFRPLERTMRMKRQPVPVTAQTRPEMSQRFRPTLTNPNDFHRSEDVIERLIEAESLSYYNEPDGFYPDQFEDNYQEADLTPLPGGSGTAPTEFHNNRQPPTDNPFSSFIPQPSSFVEPPALARALERIDTPLTVNNPYAEEVGERSVISSFEPVSPVEMVHRTQEQAVRGQEPGVGGRGLEYKSQEAGVRGQNLGANLNPLPPFPKAEGGELRPSPVGEGLGERFTQSSVLSPTSSPALARAMERMDTPITVNNPAAQQVVESATPVFGNFEAATASSPTMVHRAQEQAVRNQESGVGGRESEYKSQESGVRSQNTGANLTPLSGGSRTAPTEFSDNPPSSFILHPSSFEAQSSPAIMRALERIDTPITVNNIFAEQPGERQVSPALEAATASTPAMIHRNQEQATRNQGSEVRSQNLGTSGQPTNLPSLPNPNSQGQTVGGQNRESLTPLSDGSRTAPTEYSDNPPSSFILHPSSFAEAPALARALERIDTPITVNNVFAEKPGERPVSAALEAATASTPAMIHRAQEQATRSQEPGARSQNLGTSRQPANLPSLPNPNNQGQAVGGHEQGTRIQKSEVRSQNRENLTPLSSGSRTAPTEFSDNPSSSFILHPSSFAAEPPALARALERIDTPITVNNVYAEQPGERMASAALEAATASSPAMIHRSQELEVRSQNLGTSGQPANLTSLPTPNYQEQGANLTPFPKAEGGELRPSPVGEGLGERSTQHSALSTQHSQSPALARAIERLIEQNETGFARTESSAGLTQRANPTMPVNGNQPMLEAATPAMVHRAESRSQESGVGGQKSNLTPLSGGSRTAPTEHSDNRQLTTDNPFSSFAEPPPLARAIQRMEQQIAAEESRTEDGFLMNKPPAQTAELVVPPLLLRKVGDYVPETRDENRIMRVEETSPFAAPAQQSLAEALDMLHLLPSMRETAKQNAGNSVARQVSGDNGAASPTADSSPVTAGNPLLNAVMRSMDSGAAKALEGGVQSRLSGMFGRNFEHVRVHTDDHAAEATSHMGAEAFTVGQSIFFAPGRYQPETPEGQALIGHELTHIIQNATLPSLGNGRVLEASSDHQHLEREAQQVERTILRHLDPTPYTPIQTNVSRSLATAPTPAPVVERSVAPVESVHLRPADSGAIARQPEPGSYIEREIGSYNSIQRAVTVDENGSGDSPGGGGQMSDEELAEKVFKMLKERLLIERERHGLRGGSYF